MAGIKRIGLQDDITISPTRTYVMVIHDLVCPNEVRFEKFKLPEPYYNISTRAKRYYVSTNDISPMDIISCVSYEDYMRVVGDVINDVMLERKPKAEPRKLYMKGGIEEVRQMLDAYNDEILSKKGDNKITYPEILRAILKDLDDKTVVLTSILEILNHLKKFS